MSETVAIDAEKKLIDFLVQGRFLSPAQAASIQEKAKKEDQPLESVLFQEGILRDRDLGKIIADIHGWHFADLSKEEIQQDVLNLIPEALAREYGIVIFGTTPHGVKVAMGRPDNTSLLTGLQQQLGRSIEPYFATPKDITETRYRYQQDIEGEFKSLIEAQAHEAAFGQAKDSAVVKLVDLLITHAYKKRASDIHLDPQAALTMVRFRIDGVLHDILPIPQSVHDFVITRLKILSNLRTDEHQAPQDGKIVFDFEGAPVDIRVSIVPTTKGENAVLRLLSERMRQLNLEDLGLSEGDYKKLSASIKKPWGMILVTGPTGSGKTTSLYAVLRILNTKEVNIATIEDPVEYNIDGITQIQVNPKAKLTFATGLRSIVRQDPNIIMVGEIRDSETADIAINSAMTGHLVLSTLHTNDAPTALPRLLEMGVEPFLVSSTINVIVAQRLVRRICERCIVSEEADRASLKLSLPESLFEKMTQGKDKIQIYKGVGCSLCHQSGFSGRIGVYEILEMTDEVRELIMQNANADQIRKKAIEQGMTTMLQDGIGKVLNGVTTIAELLRMIKD